MLEERLVDQESPAARRSGVISGNWGHAPTTAVRRSLCTPSSLSLANKYNDPASWPNPRATRPRTWAFGQIRSRDEASRRISSSNDAGSQAKDAKLCGEITTLIHRGIACVFVSGGARLAAADKRGVRSLKQSCVPLYMSPTELMLKSKDLQSTPDIPACASSLRQQRELLDLLSD